MKHHVLTGGALLLAATVVCLSQVAVASASSGGNSANAKLCQKNGWQALVGTNGAFANEEACVSYAAQGGKLYNGNGGRSLCSSLGGTYAIGTGDLIGGPAFLFVLWTCDHFPVTSVADLGLNKGPALVNVCPGPIATYEFLSVTFPDADAGFTCFGRI